MRLPVRALVVLSLGLSVAACDAAGQIAAAGAVALFALGATAIHEGTKDQTSYCKAGSGQIYTRYGDCAAGDREIQSSEYQKLYKERAEQETQQKIASNEAARSAKTYCLTALSETPYVAASGKCQSSDRSISESEYQDKKAAQARNLSSPPSGEIVETKAASANQIASSPSTPPAPSSESSRPRPARPEQAISPQGDVAPETRTPTNRVETGANGEFPVIPSSARAKASGSAFFVAKGGVLLTNHHVIEGCDWVGVFANDDMHAAVPIADSPALDLAVLQTDLDGNEIATFADRTPDIGEDSYVAGYPLLSKLWSLNFTNGIVSSKSPAGEPNYLQTTAAVQHGNSGGPMFDSAGHVIGVVVARLADSEAQNVNFAIKGTVASGFLAGSGVAMKSAARGKDVKASAIARTAEAIVVPAICFEKN